MSCARRWIIAHCIMRTQVYFDKLLCTSYLACTLCVKSFGHLHLLRYICSVGMYRTICVLIHIIVTVLSIMPLYIYCVVSSWALQPFGLVK